MPVDRIGLHHLLLFEEAAQELLKFAFETLELEKVFATCNKENKASAAVMKKLGMTKEADLRHHERWKNGEWIDLLQYGILRDEYFGKPISS